MGAITAMIKEDIILTQALDQVSVLDGVFQTMTSKKGEIRVCQRFLRECMFILSVTVGLNLISVGWVCSAVRLLSHRHTLLCPCEVPKADRLAVTSAPYLEITQMNTAHFGHFIRLLIYCQTFSQWQNTAIIHHFTARLSLAYLRDFFCTWSVLATEKCTALAIELQELIFMSWNPWDNS